MLQSEPARRLAEWWLKARSFPALSLAPGSLHFFGLQFQLAHRGVIDGYGDLRGMYFGFRFANILQKSAHIVRFSFITKVVINLKLIVSCQGHSQYTKVLVVIFESKQR